MQALTDQMKVVLLEDEDLLRGLLVEWLVAQPEIELLDSFRSISAFNLALDLTVKDADVIITDLFLADGDALDAVLRAIASNPKKQRLVVISGRPTPDLFDRLSDGISGGWAFLLKNSNGLANLSKALQAVQSGLVMVDPELKNLFNAPSLNSSLTGQERAVMEKVAEGKSNMVIAKETFASEKTVERVLSSVYAKYSLAGISKTENPRVRATLIFRGLLK